MQTYITGKQRKQLQRAGDDEKTHVDVHLISKDASGPRRFQGGRADGFDSQQMCVTLALGNKLNWCKAAGASSCSQPGPWCSRPGSPELPRAGTRRGNLTCTEQDPPAQHEERHSWQSCLLTAATLGANGLPFRQQERKGSVFSTSQEIATCHSGPPQREDAKRTGCARGCVSHFATYASPHHWRSHLSPNS